MPKAFSGRSQLSLRGRMATVAIFHHNNYVPSKYYYVYILSNFSRTTLYTGITNNLVRRVYEHKNNLADGFSKRYSLHDLLYFEVFDDPTSAIEREKQIKSWSRKKKDELIIKFNPNLKDLYKEII